jgi:hypothetical protein
LHCGGFLVFKSGGEFGTALRKWSCIPAAGGLGSLTTETFASCRPPRRDMRFSGDFFCAKLGGRQSGRSSILLHTVSIDCLRPEAGKKYGFDDKKTTLWMLLSAASLPHVVGSEQCWAVS